MSEPIGLVPTIEDYPTPEHGPGWVGENNCWHHGYEPAPDDSYRLCMECGHCYITREDVETLDYALRLSFERDWADYTATALLARDIHICPLCTHDF